MDGSIEQWYTPISKSWFKKWRQFEPRFKVDKSSPVPIVCPLSSLLDNHFSALIDPVWQESIRTHYIHSNRKSHKDGIPISIYPSSLSIRGIEEYWRISQTRRSIDTYHLPPTSGRGTTARSIGGPQIPGLLREDQGPPRSCGCNDEGWGDHEVQRYAASSLRDRVALNVQGLDTSKPPSKMEMLKLSMDKDLRDAATNVGQIVHLVRNSDADLQLVTQLKEAGVELDAQVCSTDD